MGKIAVLNRALEAAKEQQQVIKKELSDFVFSSIAGTGDELPKPVTGNKYLKVIQFKHLNNWHPFYDKYSDAAWAEALQEKLITSDDPLKVLCQIIKNGNTSLVGKSKAKMGLGNTVIYTKVPKHIVEKVADLVGDAYVEPISTGVMSKVALSLVAKHNRK